MSLRPLLDIALEDERFRFLAGAAREGGSVPVHMSAYVRPYLLAALAEAEEGFAGRPLLVVAADDIGARDLAHDLRAYLGRRVAVLPVARHRLRARTWHRPAPGRASNRGAGRARRAEPAVVVASAVALAEAVPDTSLRPAGFTLERGEQMDLTEVGELLVDAGYERIDQVEERGQFAIRGGILDVFRRRRSALRGWSCSATRSSRSAGSRPSRSAPWGRWTPSSCRLPPSSRPSIASWPSSRSRTRRVATTRGGGREAQGAEGDR